MKFSELREELLSDPEVAAAYEALKPKYALINALIHARRKSGLTQSEIADRMGVSLTLVNRMESGDGRTTLVSLQKYAKATGQRIELEFAA